MSLRAPFPWFGGKSRVADEVWARFGGVQNYVEPFFGSGAVLLGRPGDPGTETVNDRDGFVANFWRAVQSDAESVAHHADHPVFENDLHARHAWLVGQAATLVARLEGNPEWFDATIAGWWCWGLSCWIGSGFCSGVGPWATDAAGMLTAGHGRGVNRQMPHLGLGRGVNRQMPHLGEWFNALQRRLRRVRVCSGDWARIIGPSPTTALGVTGVFLDPPYADTAGRDGDIYRVDDDQVAHAAREWAVANGDNPLLRIALCGYDGEHQMPTDWSCHGWDAGSGYSGQGANSGVNGRRERVWFSPHCLGSRQGALFPGRA